MHLIVLNPTRQSRIRRSLPVRNSPCHAHLALNDRLPGPASAHESIMWPRRVWESLEVQGKRFFDQDFAAIGRQRLFSGLLMTTDYSGSGSPEEAFNLILEVNGENIPENMIHACLRAGDQASHCRDILMHHKGCFQPRCVHGDILERCSLRSQDKMKKVLADHFECAKLESKRVKRSIAFADFGYRAAKSISKFMLDVDGVCPRSIEAHRDVHGQKCPVIPRKPLGFSGLRWHFAGINCYDWNTMGFQYLWLGQGTKPFKQWLRERLLALEDVLVVECVWGFDSDKTAEFLEEYYSMTVLRISPTLFGEPVERQRKYMLLLKKDKLAWLECVALDVQQAFDRLFARAIRMLGEQKFRSPKVDTVHHLASQIEKRRMPACSRTGKPWSFFQVASKAVQRSINDHERALCNRCGTNTPKEAWIANLAQNADYMPATQYFVPALLRSSRLWLCGRKRWPLTMELFELQGFQDEACITTGWGSWFGNSLNFLL
eukprot:Skav204349  [mRNA]  locus=scaffold3936:119677:121146:+ [translate_table: standard]